MSKFNYNQRYLARFEKEKKGIDELNKNMGDLN